VKNEDYRKTDCCIIGVNEVHLSGTLYTLQHFDMIYIVLVKELLKGHLDSPVKITDFKLPFTLKEIGIFLA
jgi:hypothetical protein